MQTKNDVFIAMKKVFDEANINIPFSRIDVSIVANDSTSK
jgi:small-conductance mechanosensitive channel